MYDIIENLIGHAWVTGDSSQQYIFYTSAVLVLLFSTVFIDLLYRVINGIFKGRN